MRKTLPIAIIVLLLLLAAAGYWWWTGQQAPPPPPQDMAPQVAQPAPAPAAAPSEPAVRYPIAAAEAASDVASAPPEQALSMVEAGLQALLGQRTVLQMLQTDQFAQRVVATVDNLGRSFAAPRLWPVNPSAGRFTVQQQGEATVIAETNQARYAGFVAMLNQLDVPGAVALYTRLYPMFQRAYEELGYPRRHFNDRLVDVIDELLATPEPAGPVALKLTEVKGQIKPVRPWVRYEYADPALEALHAGQKIMLRFSPAQRAELKAKLGAIRALLVQPAHGGAKRP